MVKLTGWWTTFGVTLQKVKNIQQTWFPCFVGESVKVLGHKPAMLGSGFPMHKHAA